MLNCERANPSTIMFNGDGGAGGGLEELISQSIQKRDIFDQHSHSFNDATIVTPVINPHDFFHPHHRMLNNPNFYDPPPSAVDCVTPPSPFPPPLLSLDTDQAGFFLMPKLEHYGCNIDFSNSLNLIGLNLAGHTYFPVGEDDIMNQLGRRSRSLEAGLMNSPRCQIEGCNADLSLAKHYHRRHKVCEFHSKASTVLAAGLTQRYCQQCSRFHILEEFDEGKRSCRKRLADHNRRRRKSSQNESTMLINDQP
ncbi:unnamed protein product [Lactuca virosa]|uniref:SBP-type domain-containing protein n=1 Tax=Lactuca virosa TaxID=75947 RepID=A0AAU9NN61_9ASTR|nr:unnamed protein product [Lactuca virosa]